MPINPSIAMGFQAPQIESPLNAMAKMIQLRQAEQENKLGAMKMQEYERGVEEQNRLRSVLSGLSGDTEGQVRTLTKAGFLDEARKLAESHAKADKDAREAQKAKMDIDAAKTAQLRDLLPRVTDQASYDAWRALSVRELPETAALIPPQFSPETVQQLALTADKALEKHFVNRDTGAEGDIVAIPKWGNGPATVVPGSQFTKTMTPGEAARLPLEQERVGLERQRVGLEKQRVDIARAEADRKSAGPEVKPLTALQTQRLRKDFANDTALVNASKNTADELEKVADELVGNVEKGLRKHPGLSGITGWNAPVPDLPNSDAAKARQRLNTLLGKVKTLGRQIATQDGKLGNMAVKEWEMLSDSVQNIDFKAGNPTLQVREVVRQARNLERSLKEKLELTYEETGLLDRKATTAPTAGTNPHAGKTDEQIKKELGL